jgi:hypothetical protein
VEGKNKKGPGGVGENKWVPSGDCSLGIRPYSHGCFPVGEVNAGWSMAGEQGGTAVVLIGAAAAAYFFGVGPFAPQYTYRAEIGYYLNGEQAWFVGSDKTYDECMSEAISRFNSINVDHPRRAFSWACRKMQGEQFLDRVR